MLKFDWNFLFTIINLVIFYILMRKFIFGKIISVMDKRKELIQKQFDEADEAKAQAEQIKEEYQSHLDNAESERQELINCAKAEAKIEYDKIIDKAQLDAERVKADAKKSAELETEKARLAVNEEIAQIAMETAAKIVGDKASPQTDSELYNKFLDESSDD